MDRGDRRSSRALPEADLDRLLDGGTLSADDLATRSGVPVDLILEIYRLIGLAPPSASSPYFDEAEVDLFRVVSAAAALPEGLGNEILRSINSGLTTMAETAVAAFVGSVESDMAGLDEPSLAETTLDIVGMGLTIGALLGPLFRHHLRAAVGRHRSTASSPQGLQLAIGFVDLVGFTPATAAMSTAALTDFVRRLHARTFDAVSSTAGRIVKHIGDEIMFAAPNLETGCEVAVALIDAFAADAEQARGGMAHGGVVTRHGDLYGTTVNLAARLADVAVPGEVLVHATALGDLTERFTIEPAGRRMLKGFAEPVEVVSLLPPA